jgi:cell division control protein 6
MKKNIFSEKNDIEGKPIFKDESVFYPDYFPQSIPCREAQIKELTFLLKPLLVQKKANNVLISGPPGTGKTLSTNFVLKELCEYTKKVRFTYINVIKENTRVAVLSKIVSFFGGVLPRRGLAVDEIISRTQELFSKADFSPIIILDEIDKMDKDETSKLLYDLSRFNVGKRYFTLILITNYRASIQELDNRTQSTLFLSDIEFLRYKPLEIKGILKERIEFGLVPGSISEDLIGYVSGFAAGRGGDARIAIDLIYKAGKNSEKVGQSEITKEILLSSARLVDAVKFSEKIKYLSPEEYDVLLAIDEGINVSSLYTKFDLSERTIRRYLDNLEKLELIKIESYWTGKGEKRRISLRVDPELLKKKE